MRTGPPARAFGFCRPVKVHVDSTIPSGTLNAGGGWIGFCARQLDRREQSKDEGPDIEGQQGGKP